MPPLRATSQKARLKLVDEINARLTGGKLSHAGQQGRHDLVNNRSLRPFPWLDDVSKAIVDKTRVAIVSLPWGEGQIRLLFDRRSPLVNHHRTFSSTYRYRSHTSYSARTFALFEEN